MNIKKKKGGEGGANWMDTYGDMVTLLLCFFVLLYSMSTIDEKKWQMIVMSFNPNVTSVPTQSIPQGPVGSNSSGGGPGDAPTEDQMEEILEEMYLALQDYQNELIHLESKYGMPEGRLYLAFRDGSPAGCVGLRKLDERNCEMKRLYVRPQYRGARIGERLARQVIDDARAIGYAHMLLDTFPFLESAIRMYRALGFYEVERYNDNPMFIQESTAMVLSQLRGEQARDQFVEYLNQYFSGGQQEDSAAALQKQAGEKSVMDVIARLLGRRPDSDELMLLNPEKVEKILRSLLSSPCNFTPLLHFVVPVQYEDIRSFAEIWINQNGEEDDRQNRGRGGKCLHMLLVFDISDIGRFEMELYVREKVIDLSLFCPPGYLQEYTAAQADLSQCLRGLDYRFGEIQFNRLERPRSLMDVFRSLPYRRTGVDVKV